MVKCRLVGTCALKPSGKFVSPEDIVQLGVVVHFVHAVDKVVAVEMRKVHFPPPVVDRRHIDDAGWS